MFGLGDATTESLLAIVSSDLEKDIALLARPDPRVPQLQAALDASLAEAASLRSRVSLLESGSARSTAATAAPLFPQPVIPPPRGDALPRDFSSAPNNSPLSLAALRSSGAATPPRRAPSPPLDGSYLVADDDSQSWTACKELIQWINREKDELRSGGGRAIDLTLLIQRVQRNLRAFYVQCLELNLIDAEKFRAVSLFNNRELLVDSDYVLDRSLDKRTKLLTAFRRANSAQSELLHAGGSRSTPQELQRLTLLSLQAYLAKGLLVVEQSCARG